MSLEKYCFQMTRSYFWKSKKPRTELMELRNMIAKLKY